jgi:hypothetical protein
MLAHQLDDGSYVAARYVELCVKRLCECVRVRDAPLWNEWTKGRAHKSVSEAKTSASTNLWMDRCPRPTGSDVDQFATTVHKMASLSIRHRLTSDPYRNIMLAKAHTVRSRTGIN